MKSQTSKKQIAIGLSGGVDSAVSAALLIDQGYQVTGVYLDCWRGPGCRAEEDRKEALDIALKLNIPFGVLDFKEAYKRTVVDYFYSEYAAGRTPNPDTMCNREIKFGLFYDEMITKRGFDYIATGHYARVLSASSKLPATSYQLCRGIDPLKDQSYFLYLIRHDQLPHILFPIGHLTKKEVRAEAQKRGLPVATKPDSQGICFIGQVKVDDFLKSLGMEERVGDIVIQSRENTHLTSSKSNQTPQDDTLAIVGQHYGAWFYTVGQRVSPSTNSQLSSPNQRKLYTSNLISAKHDPQNLPSLYVLNKDVKSNTLTIGTKAQCYRKEFTISDIHWINKDQRSKIKDQIINLSVRIRHGGDLIPAQLTISDSKNIVKLSQPIFAIAPGQACVFYQDQICLGGAIIC